MSTFEAHRVQSAVDRLRASVPGSTPDNRIDAIVESIEAISQWIRVGFFRSDAPIDSFS